VTLDGRTALVTGAARGIGLAITERLLRDGCRVALLDRDGEVEAVAKRLGAGTVALVADVTRTDDVDRSVQRVVATWGRLDVVVNNAGITGRSYPIWELSDEDWHQVIACDLTSVFLVCRAAIRVMLAAGRGRIIRRSLDLEDPDGTGRPARGGRCAGGVAGVGRVLVLDGRGLRPVRRPRDLLGQSSRRSSELDVTGRLLGDVSPEQRLDDVEGHVDPRRDAGRRDDAVVHHPLVAIDLDPIAERPGEGRGRRIQASVSSSWIRARVPNPPGTTSRSMDGASANAKWGSTRSPPVVATGAVDLATVKTWKGARSSVRRESGPG